MDTQEVLDTFSPFLRKHFLSLTLGLLGSILTIYGIVSLLGKENQSQNVVFEKATEVKSEEKDTRKKIFADIEGAVVKPGVYQLSSDSRIQDVLIASGGLISTADREWVSQHINLAQKIKDGFKLYIPQAGEVVSSHNTESIAGVSTSLININLASASELDSLSGIGPVTSQKIIEGRPYEAIEDLITRKIVSKSVFEKIKDKIVVY